MSFFPIINPGGFLTTISQQDSATSTTHEITVPASVQEGDLLVLMDSAYDGPVPSTVVPSGFTSIVNTAGSSFIRQIASYKIAVDSDASSTLTGMNGASDRKMLYVFRGNVPIRTVNVSTPNSQATSGNPASQSVSAGSFGTAPLIVFGCYSCDTTGTVDPRTFSTTKDGEINADTRAYLAYKIYNSSPANTSIDMDDEGLENVLQSFYIEGS